MRCRRSSRAPRRRAGSIWRACAAAQRKTGGLAPGSCREQAEQSRHGADPGAGRPTAEWREPEAARRWVQAACAEAARAEVQHIGRRRGGGACRHFAGWDYLPRLPLVAKHMLQVFHVDIAMLHVFYTHIANILSECCIFNERCECYIQHEIDVVTGFSSLSTDG